MPYRQPGTTNGGNIDRGTLARQEMTPPRTTGLDSDPTGISRLLRKARCVRRAYDESNVPAARIFLERTSFNLGEIGKLVFDAVAVASIGLLATTGIGAALGAAVGAFGGGVGAVPGAAIGAKLGLDAGLVLLNALGLAFLVMFIAHRIGEIVDHYRTGIALAWDAGDQDSTPLRDVAVARAAEEIGRGKALLIELILMGIVAAVLQRGLGFVTKELRSSKFGADFAAWIEQNIGRLTSNPKFRVPPKPAPESPGRAGSAQTPSALKKAAEAKTETAESPPPRRAESAAPPKVASGGVPEPRVDDPKLKNLMRDLYKGAKTKDPIGTGSTADAIRYEKATGEAVGGRFHTQKGEEYARALEKWIRNNPQASASDRTAAQEVLGDLRNALGGK